MPDIDFTEIEKLSERYEKNPKSKIFVHLADAYRKNDMIDEALEVLNNGLHYHPNYALAYLIMGKCFFEKRMFTHAKELFVKTLTLDPRNIVALRMLAQTYGMLHDKEGQNAAYRAILSLDSSDAPARESIEHLTALQTKETSFTISTAQEHERRQDLSRALEVYEYLLSTHPSDTSLQRKVDELKEQLKKTKPEEDAVKTEEEEIPRSVEPDISDGRDEPESQVSADKSMPPEDASRETPHDAEIKIKSQKEPEEALSKKDSPDEEKEEKQISEEPVPPHVPKPEAEKRAEPQKVPEYFRPLQYLLSGFMNEANYYHNRDERPLDLQDRINKFLRRKNLFFYIAVPVFVIIFLMQSMKPYTPVYRATFDIGVLQERQLERFFSTYEERPTLQIGTVTQRVIANLLSVNVAEKVVDTLSLYAYIEEGNSDIKVEAKIKKEFNEPIGPLKLLITGNKCKIIKFESIVYEGRLNEYVDLDFFELKIVRRANIPEGKTYLLTIYPRKKMALAVRNSLSIKVLEADKIEPEMGYSGVPFSGEAASERLVTAKTLFPGLNLIGILRIRVHWSNPDDALRIAEALSEQIIREDVGEKSLHFIQSQVFIDTQLTLYQNRLNQFEEEIKRFKEGKGITDLKASTQTLIEQTSSLESRKNQLQIEQKVLLDLREYLGTEYLGATEGIEVIPNFAASMLSDPVLQDFYSQLLQAEAKLKGLLREYSSGHPKVLEMSAKLDGLKQQLREEVKNRTSSIKTEIASVSSQIRMLQRKLENVPEDEILLARLERDRETAEKLYTFFAEKLEETRVQEAGVTSDLRIINPALVSSGPVNAKNPLLALFLAVFMSVIAGVVAVFIADYVDNTVKDPDVLKEKIGLSIFASIPIIEDEKVETKKVKLFERFRFLNELINKLINKLIKKKKPVETLRILTEDVSSAEFESFRKLSINLDFAHPEKKYRVIYVTSAGPEEGKTFIALNFGVVLGTMGKKVILIDTDFRKKSGHLTEVAKLKKEGGLFDVLKGEAKSEDVIIPFNASSSASHRLSSLALLPVGKIPLNPFVFLESEKMKDLIRELKEKYEYVIIDGVPLLLFADATYLANFADGVLLTARHGKTGFKELENARDILLTAKSNIIGIVMNGVPKTRGSYYYRYYHRYYKKYYKTEQPNTE